MNNAITLEKLNTVLSAHIPIRTIKSDYLIDTKYENWNIDDTWEVAYITFIDGVLEIQTIPSEFRIDVELWEL